ncbi:group II intron maturase-specific domain-containing protein [Streptomyces sp. NPDC058239]|uniref:group II intron maturase-specific domain-containing protein n=1 Tax=Streptomyces sp. NPDC058239 TaxID=3346395 RepID=UPI0036EFB501
MKELTGRQNVGLSLESLLHRLNSVLRGWCTYFRPGVSNVAFYYLSHYTWMRVTRWIRRKHPGITWKRLRRRRYGGGGWPTTEEAELFNPAKGKHDQIPTPGNTHPVPVAHYGMRN